MSKEEIAAYYERKMQQQAENQTKIIQNLRGELTRSNEKLQNKENALNQSKELDGILTGSSGFGSDWGSSATGVKKQPLQQGLTVSSSYGQGSR